MRLYSSEETRFRNTVGSTRGAPTPFPITGVRHSTCREELCICTILTFCLSWGEFFLHIPRGAQTRTLLQAKIPPWPSWKKQLYFQGGDKAPRLEQRRRPGVTDTHSPANQQRFCFEVGCQAASPASQLSKRGERSLAGCSGVSFTDRMPPSL